MLRFPLDAGNWPVGLKEHRGMVSSRRSGTPHKRGFLRLGSGMFWPIVPVYDGASIQMVRVSATNHDR
jgi:hypothetical protein